ncbi:unnamed protein product, partial [marine sediment metagenome]
LQNSPFVLNGITGHRDCIIDGMLVDVKSASPFSFAKFKGGLQYKDDAFGYLTQLGSYLLASQEDDRLTCKDRAAFLVMDKVSGQLHLDYHTFTQEDFYDLEETVNSRIQILSDPSTVPTKGFHPIDQNKPNAKGWVNGNKKLGVNCSYCPFKQHCWPEMRTFLYSNKPVFLTTVVKEPKVYEVPK